MSPCWTRLCSPPAPRFETYTLYMALKRNHKGSKRPLFSSLSENTKASVALSCARFEHGVYAALRSLADPAWALDLGRFIKAFGQESLTSGLFVKTLRQWALASSDAIDWQSAQVALSAAAQFRRAGLRRCGSARPVWATIDVQDAWNACSRAASSSQDPLQSALLSCDPQTRLPSCSIPASISDAASPPRTSSRAKRNFYELMLGSPSVPGPSNRQRK